MTFKQLFVRSLVTFFLPLLLAWAFIHELASGIKTAFYYAWLEMRIELETYRREMKRTDY